MMFLAAVAPWLVGASCDPSTDEPCPSYEFTQDVPLDLSVTIEDGRRVFTNDDCAALLWSRDGGTVGEDARFEVTLSVACFTDPDGADAISVAFELGDVREWDSATTQVVADTIYNYSEFPDAIVDPEDGRCTLRPADGTARVTIAVEVTEATGAPAPYPAIVDQEFRRRIRLVGEAPAVTATAAVGGRPCTREADIQFDIEFEVTADDIVSEPDAICSN